MANQPPAVLAIVGEHPDDQECRVSYVELYELLSHAQQHDKAIEDAIEALDDTLCCEHTAEALRVTLKAFRRVHGFLWEQFDTSALRDKED